MRIRLRPATWEDRRVLFEWANDPVTRANAFLSVPIEWESHVEWLRARLDDPDCTRILIAEQGEGTLLGQIRFDRTAAGSNLEIDYSVDPAHRGNRIGAVILEKGLRRIAARWPDVTSVVGNVKRENVASVRSFHTAGFHEDESSDEATRFVWRRQDRQFVLAGSRPWCAGMVERLSRRVPGSFHMVETPEQLTPEWLQSLRPSYVFFPHWSWMISDEIYSSFDCVVFHMTDVPFGRGGSPLQNLIARGITETKVSALFVERGLDTGDVLLKRELSLYGAAEEIYLRVSHVIEGMIQEIIDKDPSGEPQQGEPVVFKRRSPEESTIEGIETLDQLFDHIRMLDAEGYPHAFLRVGSFLLEFTRASRRLDKLTTDCTITLREDV